MEINELYPTLSEPNEDGDTVAVDLFEATVHYFAAHVSLYHKTVRGEQRQTDDAFEGSAVEAGGNESGQAATQPDLIEHAVEVETEHPASDVVFTPVTVTEEAESPESEDEEIGDADAGQPADEDAEIVAEEAEEPEQEQEQEEAGEALAGQDEAPPTESEAVQDEEAQQEEVAQKEDEWEEEDEQEGTYYDDEDYLALEEEAREGTDHEAADSQPGAAPAAEAPSDVDEAQSSEPSVSPQHEERDVVKQEVVIEAKQVNVTDNQPEPRAEAPEAPARPLSINEMLAAQLKGNKPEYEPGLTKKPERLADIKSAISLNDKLLFIKDLFNGYSLAYSEAIELLNRYDDLEAAKDFLQSNYAAKNNWAEKPDTVEKLYAILDKRFS